MQSQLFSNSKKYKTISEGIQLKLTNKNDLYVDRINYLMESRNALFEIQFNLYPEIETWVAEE